MWKYIFHNITNTSNGYIEVHNLIALPMPPDYGNHTDTISGMHEDPDATPALWSAYHNDTNIRGHQFIIILSALFQYLYHVQFTM